MSERKLLINWALYFTLINTLPAWLIVIKNVSAVITHWSDLFSLEFLITTIVGHMTLLSLLFCWLPVVCLVFFLPRAKVIITLSILLNGFWLFYLWLDHTIFTLYRDHLNWFYIKFYFGPEGKEIFSFNWTEKKIVLTAIIVVLLSEFALAKLIWKYKDRLYPRYLHISFVLAILLLISHVSHSIADAIYYRNLLSSSRAIPLYYGVTAKRFLDKWDLLPYSNKATEKISYTNPHSMNYPLKPLTYPTITKPFNILIILIDAWRFDTLSKEFTPNIYQFAQNNLQFHNHLSGGNCTSAGVYTLFYSIPNHYWPTSYDLGKSPVLFDILNKYQYQYGIFASAPLTSPPFNRTVFSSINSLILKTKGETAAERDKAITNNMIEFFKKIKSTSKPFFSFLFYDSTHAYSFPKEFPIQFKPFWESINHFELNNTFNPTPYFNRYKNSLYYVDSLIGKILDSLSKFKLLDNTIIIITGDHGEEFNDNQKNFWGHNSNFSRFQIQVPFIVHWPNMGKGKYNHTTSHYDLIPTLLYRHFRVTNPISDYSIGQQLFDNYERNFILAESYSKIGIIEKNKITTINPGGFLEITDQQLNPTDNTSVKQQVLQQTLEFLRRYYLPPPK